MTHRPCPIRRPLLSGRSVRLLEPVLALALSALCAPAVLAEPSQFTSSPLRTLDATAMLEKPSGFTIGQFLRFIPLQTKTAKDLMAAGFQIRLFRVEAEDRRPEVVAEFEPCLVFLGAIFQFPGAGPLPIELNLGRLQSIGWLSLVDGQQPTRGRYRLVVEPLGRKAELIRIERGAVDKFFAQSFYFEVSPGGPIAQAEVTLELTRAVADRQRVLEAARRNDPSLDCVRLADQSGSSGIARLLPRQCDGAADLLSDSAEALMTDS